MEIRLLTILASAFVGFSVVTIAQTSPTNKPSTIQLPPPPTTSESNRSIKLKLQVRSPDHLLVKEGDTIRKGQVIADQIDDRTRLNTQALELQESLKRTQDSVILDPIAPLRIPELSGLPSPNYAAEEAAIEKSRRVLERTTEKAKLQQRMLDLLKTSNGLPEMIEHESIKLGEAIGEAEVSLAEHDLTKGKLIRAQGDYQKLQYENSVNISRAIEEQSRAAQIYQQRIGEAANQKRIKESQVTQLKLQIQSVEDKLSLLAQIKSPYVATIRRIRIIDQVGNYINYELVLSTTSPSPTEITPSPSDSILRGGSRGSGGSGGSTGGSTDSETQPVN